MDSWRRPDGSLFFSGMELIERSENVVVIGDDIYGALLDLNDHLPYSNIIGYVLNESICENLKEILCDYHNIVITNNIDDIVYMMYEYSSYSDCINTLVFPGTLSYIRTGTSVKEFDDLLENFIVMNFTNIVLYDSFCYKTLSQITPLGLYFSVMNNPRFNKEMIKSYELFYGSIMYYVNFIRFFIKYKLWEDYGGNYEWFDILEDCQELSLNWNDFIKKIVSNGYKVSYVKMFADNDIKDYIKEATGHTIKVATQTRAVFTAKDSYYAR